MKTFLRIIGAVFLLFAVMAGLSSAREWFILKNLSGYQKDRFTITGTRVSHGRGDGTDYHLVGHGERGEYEIAISAGRHETFSSATGVGKQITVFRNPAMPSFAFQKESVNVIFEEDWRDRAEVAVSAKSTMLLGMMAMLSAILAVVAARFLSLR